jgi:hypothetical protein
MSDLTVVGVLLVGAEGCAEAEEAPWLRDATQGERLVFERGLAKRYEDQGIKLDPRDLYVDGIGRPYFLKAVLDHPELPDAARHKAERYSRVVHLID